MFSMYVSNLVKHQPNPTIQCGTGMQWHPIPLQYNKPPPPQTKPKSKLQLRKTVLCCPLCLTMGPWFFPALAKKGGGPTLLSILELKLP